MGEIRQIVARLVATRDWSVAEQVRLLQLASDLDRRAPGVEAVFGESDTGDPWCVIKGADDDVLLHIARIGRNVIVHDVAAGLIQEGRDLWAILDRQDDREGGVAVASDAVVVDHQLESRDAHFLLALVVAQAFGLDLETLLGDGAHAAESTPAWGASEPAPALPEPEVDRAASDAHAPQPSPAPASGGAVTPSEAAGPTVARPADEAGPVRASSTPSAQAEPTLETRTPDSEAAQQSAPVRQAVIGGDGNDTLVGGPGADLILGNLGDDVLSGGGAPDGTADVLDGGSGDDEILVDKTVVAIGGRGADVFVVTAPAGGSGDMGVVVDFDVSEGDMLSFGPAVNARILTVSSQDDVLLGTVTATSLPTTSKVAGDRLGIDLDGDGVEDGYLLVANVKVRIAAGQEIGFADDAGSRSAEAGAPLLDLSQVI